MSKVIIVLSLVILSGCSMNKNSGSDQLKASPCACLEIRNHAHG